jgi:hypothetical protein
VTRALASLLALLLALVAAPAAAGTCTAANTYNFAFNSVAAQTLSYAGNYTYTATSTSAGSKTFTVGFTTNALSSSTVNPGSGNVQMPAIGALITGVGTGNTLNVGGTFSSRTDTTFTNRVIKVIFTFATPIRDMTLKVHDIDFTANQYRDWLMVRGSNGASTYTPTLTAAGTTPSLVIGPNATYPSLTAGQALGTGTSGNTNSNAGDVNVSFAQPVTTVTVSYGNYPFTAGENSTGQQAFGISTISFCPMPSLAVSKISAPLATSGNYRFNIPGADVVYTITATNSGSSPVDLNGLVLTDILPADAKFYNGDFDPAQGGTDPFLLTAGTSGVTLTASNVTYSSNGTTWGYTPAAGYDANVKGVKFSPGGTMAANSSFTIKFRTQIK